MKRLMIFGVLLVLLMLAVPVSFAHTDYQHRAAAYAFFYQTIGIGRQTFDSRIEVINPSLYIIPVQDQGKVPQVGKRTQIGVLSVELHNQSKNPVTLEVMDELRLVDSQGRVYAPSWVSYNDATNKLFASVRTREIDVNRFNPGVSQYRYIAFLLPPGKDTYRVVSTDYSFQRDVAITDVTLPAPPPPTETPSPTPAATPPQ